MGLLSACASAQQLDQLTAQVEQLNQRLDQQRADDEQARQAAAARLDALEQRTRRLEAWSEQSQDYALDLGRTVERLEQEIDRLRRQSGDVGPGDFVRGDRAGVGLSPLEIRQHATAQGDPHFGRFSLDEALAGDPTLTSRRRGALTAIFETSMGKIRCMLLEDEAPRTVANFVGLARGVRASLDPDTGTWLHRRYYDGTIFHRVIDNFMIQGGDRLGTGRGEPGYVIQDEVSPALRHEVGTLSMANRGSNTGGSQFFITVAKTAHLDGRHTIFGRCDPSVAKKIAKVKVDPRQHHLPLKPVTLERVVITRKKRR